MNKFAAHSLSWCGALEFTILLIVGRAQNLSLWTRRNNIASVCLMRVVNDPKQHLPAIFKMSVLRNSSNWLHAKQLAMHPSTSRYYIGWTTAFAEYIMCTLHLAVCANRLMILSQYQAAQIAILNHGQRAENVYMCV